MGWESSDVFRFDLGSLSRSNDGSLALVSCLFGGYKFASVWLDLTLDPSFKVKSGQLNLKVLITGLLLVVQVWDGKPTCRKSWARNLLMLLDLTLDPSFKAKRG